MLESESEPSYTEAEEVLLESNCIPPFESLMSKEVSSEYHSQFFKQRLIGEGVEKYDLPPSNRVKRLERLGAFDEPVIEDLTRKVREILLGRTLKIGLTLTLPFWELQKFDVQPYSLRDAYRVKVIHTKPVGKVQMGKRTNVRILFSKF